VAGRLKLDLAQFAELAASAQFGTAELDKATRTQLERGQRITEVLKQPQFTPMALDKQVMIIYAAINGYLDDIALNKVAQFQDEFLKFMDATHIDIGKSISVSKELSPEVEEGLKKSILEFKQTFAK